MLNYPFANSFNLENAFVYSTLLGKPKWRAYDYSATLEWSVTNHIDLIAATVLSYTEVIPISGIHLDKTACFIWL